MYVLCIFVYMYMCVIVVSCIYVYASFGVARQLDCVNLSDTYRNVGGGRVAALLVHGWSSARRSGQRTSEEQPRDRVL